LDINQSVPSKSNPIASRSYTLGNKTVSFRGFPSLQMSKSLTANRGEDSLMSYAEGSHAQTSAAPEMVRGLRVNIVDFGEKWHESFAMFDPQSCLWKTRQCSLFGGLSEFSGIWPAWGMMQDGVCWAQDTPDLNTPVIESGYWPTPARIDEDFCRMTLATAKKRGGQPQVTTVLIAQYGQRFPLPSFGEALMDFPNGWTRVGLPLETRKFRQWLDSHGKR
jgi:hypothetical protein